MRVLVTGGAGFIGSHFVKRLAAQGDEVVVLDKLTYAGNHGVDSVRTDAGADRRAAGHGRARRDIGVGPVVDVEERALSAFEKHSLTALHGGCDEQRRVREQRNDPPSEGLERRHHGVHRRPCPAEGGDERRPLLERGLHLLRNAPEIDEVTGANAGAADLVLVRRTNPFFVVPMPWVRSRSRPPGCGTGARGAHDR